MAPARILFPFVGDSVGLDAQGGFSLTNKGAIIQFIGPAHVLLNGSSP